AAVNVPVADLRSSGDDRARLLVPRIDASRRRDPAAARPDGVALLLHTSGTTSRPKQVPLLHRNLMSSVRTIVDHYRLTPEDMSYCLMPLFHVHGLVAT